MKDLCFYIWLLVGTSASDMHFQAYLLQGLSRWNADRAAAAVTSSPSPESKTYSGLLCESVNSDEGFVDAGDDQTVAPAETVLAAQQADSSNVSGEGLT